MDIRIVRADTLLKKGSGGSMQGRDLLPRVEPAAEIEGENGTATMHQAELRFEAVIIITLEKQNRESYKRKCKKARLRFNSCF